MNRWNEGLSRIVRSIGALALLLAGPGCSVFELNKYKSFGDWYVAPPEIVCPASGTEREEIDGGRSLCCGLLQTPEQFLQPFGGWTVPEPTTVCDDVIDEAFVATAAARVDAWANGWIGEVEPRVAVQERGGR